MIEVYSQVVDGVWFGAACIQGQIVASTFGVSQHLTLSNILESVPLNVPFQVFHEPSSFGKEVLSALRRIYIGQNVNASLPLAMSRLPSYTQKVLKATAQIPLGYVTSYGLIAKAVGGGPRAVGNVMASNPFAPIVPCHRVVKSDFTLGGYGGGLRVKVGILGREKRGYLASKEVAVNGRPLQVYPVEYVLKDLA